MDAGGSRSARELDRGEIDSLIERNCWGVLSLVNGTEPYAVPVIYGYDGTDFVFANGPGRKVEIIDANPRVCLVITEAEEAGKRWRSVVVKGHIEWIDQLTGKLSAFNLLRKQVPQASQRVRDAARLAQARVARIVAAEITGRAVD
jgi:nitroimidazol reductase NimA-like FMN-containing flavoprotein (pyridoxamine 5'-phosphate oxidase superfamily)